MTSYFPGRRQPTAEKVVDGFGFCGVYVRFWKVWRKIEMARGNSVYNFMIIRWIWMMYDIWLCELSFYALSFPCSDISSIPLFSSALGFPSSPPPCFCKFPGPICFVKARFFSILYRCCALAAWDSRSVQLYSITPTVIGFHQRTQLASPDWLYWLQPRSMVSALK